jgi:hypothetical protein
MAASTLAVAVGFFENVAGEHPENSADYTPPNYSINDPDGRPSLCMINTRSGT